MRLPTVTAAAPKPQPPVAEVTSTPTDRELASYMLQKCREGLNATPVVERAPTWIDMEEFPDAGPRVDKWFIAFEGKMAAARIPRARWAQLLMECPKIDIEIKRVLSERGLAAPTDGPAVVAAIADAPSPHVGRQDEDSPNFTAYDRIRRYLLTSYGPVFPLGTFQLKIYQVKADTREGVVRQLNDWVSLYNRAAADAGEKPMSGKMLLLPFIQAFSPEVQARLEAALSRCLEKDNPLYHLMLEAPRDPSGMGIPLPVASVQGDKVAADLHAMVQQAVVAAMQNARPGGRQGAGAKRRRPNGAAPKGPCSGCGGNCGNRQTCPASGKPCNNCGGLGHFSRVCRQPRKQPQELPPQHASQLLQLRAPVSTAGAFALNNVTQQ